MIRKKSKRPRLLKRLSTEYKRRAAKRGFNWALSEEIFVALVTKTCHYCGARPRLNTIDGTGKYRYRAKVNGIDRKNNLLGYTQKNCLTCCTTCNMMKGRLSYKAFVDQALKIAEGYYAKVL
jgi:hypothetical protein